MHLAVTTAGSGIAQAVLDSCSRSSAPLTTTALDLRPLAFGLYDADFRHCVPRTTDERYIPALREICKTAGVTLLIPALDTELVGLASAAPLFEEQGTSVLVGPEAFVALCRDKLQWSKLFGSRTGLVVPSLDVGEARAAVRSGLSSFPLVAKPRDGSASRGVRVVRDETELCALPAGMLVQPHLLPAPGDPNRGELERAAAEGRHVQLSELSLQYVFSKTGELVGRMATINRLKDGVPLEIVPVDYEPMRAALQPLVDLLVEHGARGPVNLQGRITADGPRFFECNPRFTGITGVRAMLGFNEVDWLARDWLGLPQARPLRVNMRRVGIRQVGMRLVDEARILPSEGAEESEEAKAEESEEAPAPRVVAVTGASGWLGRHLVLALASSGEHAAVKAVVRSEDKAGLLQQWLHARGAQAEVAVAPGPAFSFGLAGVDLLVNLASARPAMGGAALASSLTYQMNLIREAEMVNLPATINVSSQSVYQPGGRAPCREDDQVGPAGGYGMMKLAVEQMVGRVAAGNKATRATSLRLARLYGLADGMRWREVPHAFARKAARGELAELTARRQRYDLIHIRDAVEAIVHLARLDDERWEPLYNVGGETCFSLADIADAANEAARKLGLPGAAIRESWVEEGCSTVLDSSRLVATGWKPLVHLGEAMLELVDLAARAPEEPEEES